MSAVRLVIGVAALVSLAPVVLADDAASMPPEISVTVLVENSALDQPPGLVAEHGLALLVEKDGHALLFDTGSSGDFMKNAEALGADLGRVEVVVLSHAHRDHTGGLAAFLRAHPNAVAVLHPAARGNYVAVGADHEHVIGIDPALFTEFGDRIRPVGHNAEVAPGMFVLSPIPHTHPAPRNAGLSRREGDRTVPDDFAHEIGLAVRGSHGLVVFSGCSHTGAANVVEAARQRFPGVPVQALIAGLHTGNPATGALIESKESVEALGRTLKDLGVRKIYTGHCTGTAALAVLRGVFGDDAVRPIPAGTRIAF